MSRIRSHSIALLMTILFAMAPAVADDATGLQRRLYVAAPGIRDYLEYGGHGVLVFDVDAGHRFLKRIPTAGLDPAGKPLNVKGVVASAATGKLYITTTRQLMKLDLLTEVVEWERAYPEGCDRLAIAPDGRTIYLPSLEGDIWNVVDAADGRVIAKIEPKSGAHNTVFGPNGAEVYLAGLKSPWLTVADAHNHGETRRVGPFAAGVRPFTVNGSQTLVFANVNELLGFEVGDLKSGKKLQRVEVTGFPKGPTKRHGCPSHGVALTPDESELWLADAANSRLHIFDATTMPPAQRDSIELRDQPGWITFGIDGTYAYPSTGEVIETKTRRIVATLQDEKGRAVHSEKMLEIDFRDGKVARAGDQFGIGQVGAPAP